MTDVEPEAKPEPEPIRDLAHGEWQRPAPRAVAVIHGIYYLLTGIWPLLHLESFFAVTGPKTDVWLVQTFGALVAVIGFALLVAARRRALSVEWAVLAGGQAMVLTLVDIVLVAREQIPPVYLGDAVIEVLLAASWLALAARRYRPSNP